MKLPSPRRQRRGEPLSPLIDVVFLLLVFFMLIGTLQPPELLPVQPPRSRGSAAADDTPLTILVTAAGQLVFQGHDIEPEKLRSLLESRISGAVAIKADAAVAAGTVLALMNDLREIGIERISLLTVAAKP